MISFVFLRDLGSLVLSPFKIGSHVRNRKTVETQSAGHTIVRCPQSGQRMSYVKTIVCLANSRKLTGRCVAGKEWNLLCSEPTPEHCHRRLVAEYLQKAWGDVEIEHIL